ncbi:DUF4838 domain-containing protein [Paenibacillus sp. LHD-117]|uniref:DUF4838 domain-containing protein n=1 Tax=Paenibacillus sp. LHD-117 TaxID=3071412 RepID=UPI0027E10E1F|nr:DUF4838 domain-containing protein [Paenibacillus sp. LHD-117]MDQ6422164.1 DUF4838 domain-containing protein [Paenibacillus sp. LHD-117]
MLIPTFRMKLISLALVLCFLAQTVYMSPRASADGLAAAAAGEGLTLVSNRQSESAVIWWSKASESEAAAFAAEEIQSYVMQITRTEIPVYEGSVTSKGVALLNHMDSALLIVSGEEADALVSGNGPIDIPAEWLASANASLADAADDSFAAETQQNRMVLAGVNERGTLYSAYELLESAGVEFFAPAFDYYEGNAEYVPSSGTLTVPDMNGLSEPSFEFRRKYVEEGWSHTAENLPQLIDWMAKNKLNTLVVPYDYIAQGNTRWDDWREELIDDLEKRGMIVEVGGHGFESFLTREKYGAAHPEWFVSGYNVFNIANEEAVDTYVNEVVAYLKARPEIGIFDSWPPDVATWPPAVLAKFGTSANAYAYVVNKLHAAVKEQLPGVRIEAIAYATHVNPPSAEYQYDESVLIDFAPYFRSYRDSVFSPANQSVINQINSWKDKFEGTFTMYEYYRRYAFHSLPVVFPQLIGQELPYYKQFGMDGIGTYSEPGDWITFEITHIILAKMSWNADLNAQELIQDYIQSRYGAAADEMEEYFRLVEEAGRSIYNSPTGDMNNATRVTEMRTKYLQAKEQLESALTKTADGSKESYMAERLLWNIEFAIADVSVDYYRLLGDNASMAASRAQAQNVMNAHRFDGIILQNSYLIREYISGYGNTNWIYDMYRGELKHAPMISTMGTYQSNHLSHIVDDKNDTVFWSNAAPLVGDYIGIDLQTVQNVKQIKLLMSKPDKPNDYIRNGVIEVSKDFEEWETVATLSSQPEADLTVEEGTEARYVRIRSTAAQSQWVIIREFAVEAEELEEPRDELQSTIEADRNEVTAGENVELTAGFKQIPASVYALEMTLDYDANVLEFVSAQSIKSGLALVDSASSAGKLRIIAASEGAGHALEGDLQLVRLSFKAKDVTDDTTSTVTISHAALGNDLGVEVGALPASVDIAVHSIPVGIPADINKDGKVSVGDLGFVAAHYGKTSASPDWAQIKHADLDKNKVIDLPDLAAVASAIIEQ